MFLTPRSALIGWTLSALAAVAPAWAQTAAVSPAAMAPAAVTPAASASSAKVSTSTSPVGRSVRPDVVVIEDDGARIEETRSGGAVKRVTVQSKVGNVRPYEIQLAPAGRDPSQERGNAGRRAWSLFDF